MRRIALLAAAVALCPTVAHAFDVNGDCTIDIKPGDVVVRGKDAVVESGKRVNDVVAVDGNVILRKGAHAKSAVAINGSVTVESGAKVTGSAISFGGKVTVASDAKVEGSRLVLGDGLKIKSEDGKDVSLSLSIGGGNIGQMIATEISGFARNCRIVEAADAGSK